jgi:aminodeoxyfutalosine deaminase
MPSYTAPIIHNGQRFLSVPSAIAVSDNGVIEGITTDIPSDVIRLPGLLCPGFINAHCHLELSYLQSAVPKGTGLPEFINQVGRIRGEFNEDIINEAIIQQDESMKQQGIVAVGDICNHGYTASVKNKSAISYTNFIECFGINNQNANSRMQNAREIMAQLNMPKYIVPHAPYSVSTSLFKKIDELDNKIISIHNQECRAEDELIRNGTGILVDNFRQYIWEGYSPTAHHCSSLVFALQQLASAKHILLVHNIYTTKEDIQFARASIEKLFWVTCPKANLYIENTLPSMYEYWIANNDIVCIGTDSLASNDVLSVYEELKTLREHKNIDTEILLKWATYNGALALNNQQLGMFAVGKKPGLINITNWLDNSVMPSKAQIKVVGAY